MPIAFSPAEPLGPLNYQNLMDNRALPLVDLHDPFLRALRTEPRLLIGRKGAGKSTVLYAMQFYDELRARLKREQLDNSGEKRLITRYVIVIQSHRQFQPIVDDVFRSVYGSISPTEQSAKATEFIAEQWEDRLWFEVISYFFSLTVQYPEEYQRERFSHVIAFCDPAYRNRLEDLPPNDVSVQGSYRVLLDRRKKAQSEIVEHLKLQDQRCFLLIDSLEEYPVNEQAWAQVVRGFLPALEYIERNNQGRIQPVAALPEELENVFMNLPGSEPGKSFASQIRLRWRPRDLKRMIAHRFSLMIDDIVSESSRVRGRSTDYNLVAFEDLRTKIKGLNLDNNKNVNKMLALILPGRVKNSLGVEETTLGYIFRHSYLAPRNILSIFTQAILSTDDYWRHHAKLSSDGIVAGVSRADKITASQQIVPFQGLYPNIPDVVARFCGSVPPFFDYKSLSTFARTSERSFRHISDVHSFNTEEILKLLYDIGVFGHVRNKQEEQGGYAEARYFFTQEGYPPFRKDNEYCLHPVFSGRYEARESSNYRELRFAYPQDVEFDE